MACDCNYLLLFLSLLIVKSQSVWITVCVDHDKVWKILKGMGIPTTLQASWEICLQVKKQQLEPDMERGVHQGCIFHPPY